MIKKLNQWQIGALSLATVPMLVFGALGGMGTYANIMDVFNQSATALGVVAAGEGATLVLAVVYVGLTLLGQSSPLAVRLGLWALPVVASSTGAIVANDLKDSVVYAITPLAMCVSAEGLGLLARRVVVYLTGTDAEARRKNARTMQMLAYHRALAANHPDEKARSKSELKSWRLARKVGSGDIQLGDDLVSVQRGGLGHGADAALRDMFSIPLGHAAPALSPCPPDEDKSLGQRVPETRDTGTIAGQVLPPVPKVLEIGPALSLAAYVRGQASKGHGRDTIRESVRSGDYAGTWSEDSLKKALQRYVPKSA